MTAIKFSPSTSGQTVVADWDETILEALIRSGEPVPFFCRAGICGQCKSVLVAGEVEAVGAPTHLLTDAEKQQGVVLLCSSRAVTDCEIRPFNKIISSDAAAWPSTFTVASRVQVHSTLLQISLVTPQDERPSGFKAGQYTRFSDPQFASLPALFVASRPGLPHLDLYLPLDDHVSDVAESLRPGAVVALSEPTGSASLRDDEPGPIVVFAERSGIASALGMMEAIAALGPAAPAVAIVLHGSPGGLLERRVLDLAQTAGIDAGISSLLDDVPAALERALAEVTRRLPSGKPRAYIKAGRETTKAIRKVLLQHGVRPWDTHVDNVAD